MIKQLSIYPKSKNVHFLMRYFSCPCALRWTEMRFKKIRSNGKWRLESSTQYSNIQNSSIKLVTHKGVSDLKKTHLDYSYTMQEIRENSIFHNLFVLNESCMGERPLKKSHVFFDLPTYLALPYNVQFWGFFWRTLISDIINGRSLEKNQATS